MATDPFPEGRSRGFRTRAATDGWMAPLRDLGWWTASISTFAERHSAYHFDAGFNECVNLGAKGMETAEEVAAAAEEWLARNAVAPGLVPARAPVGPAHPATGPRRRSATRWAATRSRTG